MGRSERRLQEYFGLDFSAFARLYPDEVSGGELQRITLMILLSRLGELVLLDEPTVNLDRTLRRRFIDFLNAEILRDEDKTVLMASHDLDFIQSLEIKDAWALEAAHLVHLDSIPRTNGFKKTPSRKPGCWLVPGRSVPALLQEGHLRGAHLQRLHRAFTPARPLDDLRHHRPLGLRQVEYDQGHPAPHRRDDWEHPPRRPGPGLSQAA